MVPSRFVYRRPTSSSQTNAARCLGGWWTRPSNWAANTAIASLGIIAVTYGIWRVSASLEVCRINCFQPCKIINFCFSNSKRKELRHLLDQYLQCWYVSILSCHYFLLLLANPLSYSVGERVYRCRKEIDNPRLIDRYFGLKFNTFSLVYQLYLANFLWRMIPGQIRVKSSLIFRAVQGQFHSEMAPSDRMFAIHVLIYYCLMILGSSNRQSFPRVLHIVIHSSSSP